MYNILKALDFKIIYSIQISVNRICIVSLQEKIIGAEINSSTFTNAEGLQRAFTDVLSTWITLLCFPFSCRQQNVPHNFPFNVNPLDCQFF